MTRDELVARVSRMGACTTALDWLRAVSGDAADCWARCDRADWMVWIMSRTLPKSIVVGIACDCVDRVGAVAATVCAPSEEYAAAWGRIVASARAGYVDLDDVVRADVVIRSMKRSDREWWAWCAVFRLHRIFDHNTTAGAAMEIDEAMGRALWATTDARAEHRWQCDHIRATVPWSAIEEVLR